MRIPTTAGDAGADDVAAAADASATDELSSELASTALEDEYTRVLQDGFAGEDADGSKG